MMPKPLIAWFAATAFVGAAALMPVGASTASRGGPQPGTWNGRPMLEPKAARPEPRAAIYW